MIIKVYVISYLKNLMFYGTDGPTLKILGRFKANYLKMIKNSLYLRPLWHIIDILDLDNYVLSLGAS